MLKSILLASAVAISAPAFAQDMPEQQTPPPQEQPAPTETTEPAPQEVPAPAPQSDAQPMPEATPDPAPTATPTPEPQAPEPEMTAPETTEPQATGQQAQATAPAQQPANAEQIAQIVDQGFLTYDKDADGDLKQEEFGAWMVALRSASEPAFTGESAADKQWLAQAHALADADKSGTVSKDELKTFLAPPAAS